MNHILFQMLIGCYKFAGTTSAAEGITIDIDKDLRSVSYSLGQSYFLSELRAICSLAGEGTQWTCRDLSSLPLRLILVQLYILGLMDSVNALYALCTQPSAIRFQSLFVRDGVT